MSIKLASLFGEEQEADATPQAGRTSLYFSTGSPAQAVPFLDGGFVATNEFIMAALGSSVARWALFNWSGNTLRVLSLKIQVYREGNIPLTVPRLQLARVVQNNSFQFVGTPTTWGFMPKRTATGLGRNTWFSFSHNNSMSFIDGIREPGNLWEGAIPAVQGLSSLEFSTIVYTPLNGSSVPFELGPREALVMFSVGALTSNSKFTLQAEVQSFRGNQLR